jgi:adenylate cyclase
MTGTGDERCVTFADLAGYTALTEAHGDVDAADVAQRFFELAAALLRDDTRLVKTIGDAVMVVADDALGGLTFGLQLLRAVERETDFPGVRVGIHHGPVVERDGDLFGATVNIAARLANHAHVGQLLATDVVANCVHDDESITVISLGTTLLKNVSQPVPIYAVADHTAPPVSQVLDPVCRMFIDADAAPAKLPWDGRSWYFCSFDCATTFGNDPTRYTA